MHQVKQEVRWLWDRDSDSWVLKHESTSTNSICTAMGSCASSYCSLSDILFEILELLILLPPSPRTGVTGDAVLGLCSTENLTWGSVHAMQALYQPSYFISLCGLRREKSQLEDLTTHLQAQ